MFFLMNFNHKKLLTSTSLINFYYIWLKFNTKGTLKSKNLFF